MAMSDSGSGGDGYGERLAAAHAGARARIGAMVRAATPDAMTRVVPACPEWTAHQLLSHCTGTPASIVAGRLPTGDLQAWLDGIVADRADQSVEALLAEWDDASGTIEASLREQPGYLATLLYDVLAHEIDLRTALGVTTPLDEEALQVALELTVANLTTDLAAHGLPGVVVDAGAWRWLAGEEPVGLELFAPPEELFRLLGGRRSRAQIAGAVVTGDLERFLPALTHGLALPDEDLRD